MQQPINTAPEPQSACWWSCDGACGYIGRSTSDGLSFRRYGIGAKPGHWTVAVDGWKGMEANAVVDDFGNLVQVPA